MKHYLHILLIILGFFTTFAVECSGQVTGNNVKVLDLTSNTYSSGASFYVEIGSQMQVDSFYTFECWMYVDTKASGDYPQIMDRETVFSLYLINLDAASSGGDYRVRFAARDNNDTIIASIRSSGKNAGSTDYQMDFHKWYHVAVSGDGGTARLFIDGNLVDDSTSNNFILSMPSSLSVTCGTRKRNGSNERFNDAAFDEFRYSDIARYTSSFSISTFSAPHATSGDPHTILLYNFDNSDLTNSTSADSYTAGSIGTPLYLDWDDAGLDQYLPLPIQYLEALNVKEYNKQVILHWATATEENNNRFEIERSRDGIEWKNIGTVKGAGNSILPCYYSFKDTHPQDINYYRLKQIDYNGKFSYSGIAFYSMDKNTYCNIYPNPSSDYIRIKGIEANRKASAIIYNAEGEFVKATPNPRVIDIRDIPKGVYFIEIIKYNSKIEVLKFIKN